MSRSLKWLGIDEAGRGCVLGDLVVAGFVYEGPECGPLADAGATDSKKLSAKKRLAVREALTPLGTPLIRRITPTEIDAGNLNRLEEDAIVDLIRTVEPDCVIIDALGAPSTLDRTVARLQAAIEPHVCVWTMEPKADLNHPVCGAASIFAKTTRDLALEALIEAHGELGSGYPSDPKTKAWLLAHAQSEQPWPDFVRTRWGTIQALAQRTFV